MKPKGKDWEQTRSILSAVHNSKEEVTLSPQWQGRVMDAIRALPTQAALEKPAIVLERMVWRFAPVACLLILAMTIVIISQDFTPKYGLVEAMMDDSMSSWMAQAITLQ